MWTMAFDLDLHLEHTLDADPSGDQCRTQEGSSWFWPWRTGHHSGNADLWQHFEKKMKISYTKRRIPVKFGVVGDPNIDVTLCVCEILFDSVQVRGFISRFLRGLLCSVHTVNSFSVWVSSHDVLKTPVRILTRSERCPKGPHRLWSQHLGYGKTRLIYMVVQKKQNHQFCHNFIKYWMILEILSLIHLAINLQKKESLKILSNRKRVATLPCKIVVSCYHQSLQTEIAIFGVFNDELIFFDV